MRRMKRHNPKRRKPAKRRAKRHNPAPMRRRRRRNDETAAAPAKKQRVYRTKEQKLAAAKALVERYEAGPKAKKKRKYTPKPRVYTEEQLAKRAKKRKASAAYKGRKLTALQRATGLNVGIFGEELSPGARNFLASLPVPKNARRGPPRGKKKKSRSARFSALALKKGSKSSLSQKAAARAYNAAMRAKSLAKSPKEMRLIRSMGLAGVHNSSMGSMFKDISALLPQMGVSAVSLAVAAVAGQMIASKIVPADKQATTLGKIAPSAISLGVGLAGYMALRKSKSMGKFAPWVLAGGVAAAAVHAIARITVKDSAGAPVSLGKRLGLPIGEYASMAGYGEYASMAGLGEYASMAGGTAYSGSRGVFSGLDDTDPVLSGTDDEDEVDMIETHADEGDNTDEGSLNGSIFD
jgi:hypothetical protein